MYNKYKKQKYFLKDRDSSFHHFTLRGIKLIDINIFSRNQIIYLDGITNELTVSNSETDISDLRKRFMSDKQIENTLVTAPNTIYLLGQLMVHSSLTDFSLRSFRTNWPFTTIRNPESFRATLAQIANGKII